jgi:GNAT superfamily N-acetyltransferase
VPIDPPVDNELDARPVTPERWPDLEALFGARGACGGCWCMWWRLPRRDYEAQKGDGNRAALRSLVVAGAEPGLLLYRSEQPVAWCALGPREAFPALDRSRTLAPVDDRPVWSVPCLFVARSHRRQGLSVALLRAAVVQAAARGAGIVEGYPVEAKRDWMPDAFAWTGLPAAFRAAGFVEVLRRTPTRPIMRRTIAAPAEP